MYTSQRKSMRKQITNCVETLAIVFGGSPNIGSLDGKFAYMISFVPNPPKNCHNKLLVFP